VPSRGQKLHFAFYRSQIAAKTLRTPHLLGFSLFAASLYAAFAQGAIRAPDEPRLQVGVAVIAALAAAAWLGLGQLSLRASKPALAALGLLLAFCGWSALTLAWSASPDGTWVEVNRVFSYTLILALAITLGASDHDAITHTARGVLGLILIVALYALAQKVIPGVHIAGLIDLNQTGQYARLQAPLDYWNALALLLCLGAPAALTLALAPDATRITRLTGLIGLEIIVVTIGFTESRGGFVALAVALGATVMLSPDRLITLAWATTAVAVGVLDLVIALSAHPLSGDNIALGRRELAGGLLLVVLLASATLSVLLVPALDRLGPRLTRTHRRRIWRALGVGALGLVALALIGAGVSHRGLGGQISHIWDGFNSADSIATSSASRLFSDSSANRVDWWGQALRAFTHRPLNGYGAGSFPVINMLFRHDTVAVQDAHSVPLQWLAETGIVGFVLALASWLLLLQQGFAAVWRAGADRIHPMGLDGDAAARRLAAAALLAGALAYSVHALYDWDWDIPGVTLPVLIMLGVLAGSRRHPLHRRHAVIDVPPPIRIRRQVGPTLKLVGLALLTALLGCFAVSAVLPAVAATKATAALTEAAAGTPAALRDARHEASYATALDPLSGAGPLASANIAIAENADALARDYAIEAIRREPTDESAWTTLVRVDLALNRDREAIAAAQRALDLDPEVGEIGELTLASDVIAAEVAAAPPQGSATAIATPGY
jgi:O-antigen ligase